MIIKKTALFLDNEFLHACLDTHVHADILLNNYNWEMAYLIKSTVGAIHFAVAASHGIIAISLEREIGRYRLPWVQSTWVEVRFAGGAGGLIRSPIWTIPDAITIIFTC